MYILIWYFFFIILILIGVKGIILIVKDVFNVMDFIVWENILYVLF